MLPAEWKDANFKDPAIRGVFADWLEERGDWRADEIRRLWIDYEAEKVYVGAFVIGQGIPVTPVRSESVLTEWIEHLFHKDTTDWRIRKASQIRPKPDPKRTAKPMVYTL